MTRLLILIAMMVASLSALQAQTDMVIDDPTRPARHEALIAHGISPEPAELIGFLRDGFPELPRGLPETPDLKSELVLAAVAELGVIGAESAVPLLIEMVDESYPDGVEIIVRRDFESFPIDVAESYVLRMLRLVSDNAITSLGLIGDERSRDTLLNALESNNDNRRINAAIALGQIGDGSGLPVLLEIVREFESPVAIEAFRAIYVITGRNYGFHNQTSLQKRQNLVEQYEQWLSENGDDPPVFRTETLRRSQDARVTRPPALDPNSLRGMLRNTYNVNDFDSRFYARRAMRNSARANFTELESIVRDEMEDIDIRRAAINWLAIANPKEARSVIRRQTNDENPLIAETAEFMLDEIPRYIEEGAPAYPAP